MRGPLIRMPRKVGWLQPSRKSAISASSPHPAWPWPADRRPSSLPAGSCHGAGCCVQTLERLTSPAVAEAQPQRRADGRSWARCEVCDPGYWGVWSGALPLDSERFRLSPMGGGADEEACRGALTNRGRVGGVRECMARDAGRRGWRSWLTDRWRGFSGPCLTGSITGLCRRGCGWWGQRAIPSCRARLIGCCSAIGSSPNDDRGRRQQRCERLSYRLFARTVRQGQVALGARLGNEIHGPVPAAFSPSPCNARCLVEYRSAEVLPLNIVS